MKIIDLRGERRMYDAPIIVGPEERTVICNGEIIFTGDEGGIQFKPKWPGNKVHVSMLSLRDLDVVNPNGPCLELVSAGKETTIDNVRVTGKGGALLTDWDGGSITNLYAFNCESYGVKIRRMHAARIHITARQTTGRGAGVLADRLRGVAGTIYSESNGGLGVEFFDCEQLDLMCHFENNNRGITGSTNWASLGHTFKQVSFDRCKGVKLRGYWGAATGQWTADPATARGIGTPVQYHGCYLQEPEWNQFWPDEKYRPIFKLEFNDRATVVYPKGAFDHANQDRTKSQRWQLFPDARVWPVNSLLKCTGWVKLPRPIIDQLSSLHDEGKENAIGTLGFGGFSYRPTYQDKAYKTLHAWNGHEFAAAVSSTWVRKPSPCYPNYQPSSGIVSWDNPEFKAKYRFALETLPG